jgi:hypothetical protein
MFSLNRKDKLTPGQRHFFGSALLAGPAVSHFRDPPAARRWRPWLLTMLVAIALTYALVLAVRPAKALFGAGDIVYDPTNWIQNNIVATETYQTALHTFEDLQEMYKEVENTMRIINRAEGIIKALGSGRVLSNLAGCFQGFDLSLRFGGAGAANICSLVPSQRELMGAFGLTRRNTSFGGDLGRLNFSYIGFATPLINATPMMGGLDVVPSRGTFLDPASSRNYSYDTFSPTNEYRLNYGSERERANAMAARRLTESANAVFDAHGSALFHSQSAAGVVQRGTALHQDAANAVSKDLAEQMLVLTDAVISLSTEVAHLRSLTAAGVRMQAALNMPSTAPPKIAGGRSSVYDEGGN